MDDGTTGPTPQRERRKSTERQDANRDKEDGRSASRRSKRSGSKNGKERASTSKERDRSRSKSRETGKRKTGEKKNVKETSKTSKPTTPKRNIVMEEGTSPYKSRAVKVEAMEQSKVQQTLAFPTMSKEIDLTGEMEPNQEINPGNGGDMNENVEMFPGVTTTISTFSFMSPPFPGLIS